MMRAVTIQRTSLSGRNLLTLAKPPHQVLPLKQLSSYSYIGSIMLVSKFWGLTTMTKLCCSIHPSWTVLCNSEYIKLQIRKIIQFFSLKCCYIPQSNIFWHCGKHFHTFFYFWITVAAGFSHTYQHNVCLRHMFLIIAKSNLP